MPLSTSNPTTSIENNNNDNTPSTLSNDVAQTVLQSNVPLAGLTLVARSINVSAASNNSTISTPNQSRKLKNDNNNNDDDDSSSEYDEEHMTSKTITITTTTTSDFFFNFIDGLFVNS